MPRHRTRPDPSRPPALAASRKAATPSADRPPPRASSPNLLLSALPDADYARISPTLAVVSLKVKTVLLEPGDPVRHYYFPGDGFCSELTVLEDGTMVEIVTVGREGVASLLGGSESGLVVAQTMVQGPIRTCFRMPAEVFRAEMDRRGPFYQLVSRYVSVLTRMIMQSTACNAVHTIEQRLARWLLTTHDHMETRSFPLTQEFVAMMLGASRPAVAGVAGRLQRAGLITYHRGQVTIVDREQLEAASCECYRTTANLLTTSTGPLRIAAPELS